MAICKWCNKKFDLRDKPLGWMANHTRWCKDNPNRSFYIKKLKDNKDYRAKYIDYEKQSHSLKKAWSDGKYNNRKTAEKLGPLSSEHKKKISDGMKKAYRENRHSGWAHINSDSKNMSRPEKTFLSLIKNDLFFEKYNIVYGFPVMGYFLDFAILNLMCDIEIDGLQHLKNNDSINHDKKRDRLLTKNGWMIYRISAKELYIRPLEIIEDLKSFLISDKIKIRKYNSDEIVNLYSKKRMPKYGNREDYFEFIKRENDLKSRSIISKLLNSDIDFSKFGWVNKASKIIGITPQKVSKWMNRYMPDFYEKNCFKRKLMRE